MDTNKQVKMVETQKPEEEQKDCRQSVRIADNKHSKRHNWKYMQQPTCVHSHKVEGFITQWEGGRRYFVTLCIFLKLLI